MDPGGKEGGEDKTLIGDHIRSLVKGGILEQKTEREWKSIRCSGRKDKTLIMIEWDILSEKGRLLKKSLRQIDCHHPQLTEFGGADCEWGCEGVIRRGKLRVFGH